jgi:hypothetical protein
MGDVNTLQSLRAVSSWFIATGYLPFSIKHLFKTEEHNIASPNDPNRKHGLASYGVFFVYTISEAALILE